MFTNLQKSIIGSLTVRNNLLTGLVSALVISLILGSVRFRYLRKSTMKLLCSLSS